MEKLITENIDIWTTAQMPKNGAGRGNGSAKQSLYGIKKLRELILKLAVRGKLVPQDPKEEPASVLLEKISKEKARLIKEGKIKKEKPLPEIGEDEKPYKLPEGWKWARIGDVGHDWGQKTPDKDFTYIEVSGIDNIAGTVKTPNRLTAAEAPSRARKIVKFGTVIYSTVRPYLKNICIIDQEYSPEPIASTAFAIFHPFQQMPGKFFTSYLRSPAFVNYVESVQTGIAYPAINDKQFFGGVIPIPPLPEQHRIVAKVDELMAFCDQLEQQQTDNNAIHQTLVETLLSTLINTANSDEFSKAWQRIAENFDTLFTTEQSIDQLKQTILQLAVMGKLVPQDPKDEPASVLLERIAKEKKQLIKEGKIKEQKPLQEISYDAQPFELPDGWAWGLIPQVVTHNKYSIKRGPFGSSIKKDYFVPSGFKVYEQQHAISDDFTRGNYYINSEKFKELKAFEVVPNDIIISCSGTVGRVAIAPSWMEPGIINQALLKLSLNQNALMNEYFKILFPAFYMKTETLTELQGTAQKNMVSVDTLKKEPFPLPPLAEQHRIVAKVDELMALCDALKVRLQEAQTTQIQLADAIVEQAVA